MTGKDEPNRQDCPAECCRQAKPAKEEPRWPLWLLLYGAAVLGIGLAGLAVRIA